MEQNSLIVSPTEIRVFEKETEMDRLRLLDDIDNARLRNATTVSLVGYHFVLELPESITTLSHVTRLEIFYNVNLCTVPASLADLYERLEHLNLSYNNISQFPECLCLLRYLRHLELSNNQLACLPPKIDALHCLELLDLNSNHIKVFPYTVRGLKRLHTLHVENCPLLVSERDACDLPTDKSFTQCALTGEDLSDAQYSFVQFVDFLGHARLPLHYVCASAESLTLISQGARRMNFGALQYD
jgi:hypothetical protein